MKTKEIEIKYSHRIPEIYEQCKKKFNADWNRGVIITYGDTIYSKEEISEDLKVHEAVHVRQQIEMGPQEWWDRYLTDKEFRLSQEVEAYKAQLEYASIYYNRWERAKLKSFILTCMVTLYGNMCTRDKARQLLDK